jgi:hypothetical protein
LSTSPSRLPLYALLFTSLVLFVVRLSLTHGLSLSDGEALWVSQAFHPEPSYLAGPGLVARLAAWLSLELQSPERIHLVTAFASTLIPWLIYAAILAAGGARLRAAQVAIAAAFLPALSIGLVLLDADLLVDAMFLVALASALFALRASVGSFSALIGFLGAGAAAGFGLLSSWDGVWIFVALVILSLAPAFRGHLRSFGPWAMLVLFMVVASPLLAWERAHEFSSVRGLIQRLGSMPRWSEIVVSVAMFVLILPPPYWLIAIRAGRRTVTTGTEWGLRTLALTLIVIFGVAMLTSRAGSPGLLLLPLLALAVLDGSRAVERTRAEWTSAVRAIAAGAVVTLGGLIWMQTSMPQRVLGAMYRPDLDVAVDTRVWGPASGVLRKAFQTARDRTSSVVVVGVHLGLCAQAQVALGPDASIGCYTPESTDFERWVPEGAWQHADTLLVLTDSRLDYPVEQEFPDRRVVQTYRADVRRHDRAVRFVRVLELAKREGFAQR